MVGRCLFRHDVVVDAGAAGAAVFVAVLMLGNRGIVCLANRDDTQTTAGRHAANKTELYIVSSAPDIARHVADDNNAG